MTATTFAPVPTATAVGQEPVNGPGDLEELRRSVRSLAECLAEVSLADPRWHDVGAPVSAVAELVRRSVGTGGATASADLAPVVRLRDLAVAGRLLLRRDVTVVDPEAARDARTSCARLVMALV